ncbi:uncharacterized protein GGS22DRAFT_176068 [Annulohypoxylon maeteangense]|uniref:uncharacterized protein n=1 Tax=Annulohypoxylon maeteangense TaxID=1927788 RepID=UPI00200811EC|nr:uncharacterized protein GGS22DRAFT_176068 [Annulohypoxylon maeteangense]KAI0880063.1 hypothetical protein GGS22DRAFT_176068 [Annulohypoxylon maeteangense]
MCFGHKDNADDTAPKPAPIRPSSSITKPKASMPQEYAPPPGPPPSYPSQSQSQSQSTYYAPPPGPPPSHSQSYQPPAGPPPSDIKNNPFFNQGPNAGSQDEEYAPPPGPPPSHGQSSKPQHDWETAVPDTALLPPPPDFFAGYDRSPSNNASKDECEAGESWCREHPLYHPAPLNANTSATTAAVSSGNITVYAPPSYLAKGGTLTQPEPGVWRGQSTRGIPDSCLATWPPLYQASAHSPLTTGRTKIIYYEVRILHDTSRNPEIGLALGFSAPPYPAFRLPGWHRGSVAVHGDDGHKYINDRWGGKDFTGPFRKGETIGIGMEFGAREEGGIRTQVFMTRDGVERGRWDLHEETDREQDLPVTGLEGYHDLCASVGCFEKVGFEIVFLPALWLWRGYEG